MVQPLRYPRRKIEQSDDYLQIDVLKYKAPGIKTAGESSFAVGSSDQTYQSEISSNSTKNILSSIILPVPEGVSDNLSAGWGASSLNPLTASLLSAAEGTIESGNFFGGLVDQILSGGKKILDAAQTTIGQESIQSGIAAAAVNAVVGGANPQEVVSRATGAILNPNIELLFSQVNLRQPFTFQFDMIPRFELEGEDVKKIIRVFKENMSPQKGKETGGAAGLFVKAPNVFRLRYMSGGQPHPYLNKFKICALLGMNVDYTGSGTYATYQNATPVHMKMTLAFQELTPIFAEDYGTDQGKIGTGY